MHYVEQLHGDVLVLVIKGKLVSLPETEALHDKVSQQLEDKKCHIVLDLKHVHRLSSMGIGAIMRCVMTVRTEGGDLRLTGLTEKVQNIFSITQLGGVIQVYDSINEAITSFDSEKK